MCDSLSSIPAQAIGFINNYHLDIVFIGVEGMGSEFGASTPDVEDAVTEQAMDK